MTGRARSGPADGYDLKSGFGTKESVFDTGPRNGMHTFENALLYTTADIDVDGADLYYLTPTILDRMDVDVDDPLDGESLLVEG